MKKMFLILVPFLLLFSACGGNTGGSDMEIPNDYIAESESLCFDAGDGWSRFYNYAPSVLRNGDYAHMFYCSNLEDNVVGDAIVHREGRRKDGVWYWSPLDVALEHGASGEWDSANVCDPDVIKGEFGYKGHTYSYLMTYLGCKTMDNTSNMFGFAVADSLSGPWIKTVECNPLYDFYEENPGYVYHEGENQFLWGWGQSGMISIDKKGKVLLNFTGRSATGQTVEIYDFSDMEHPQRISTNTVSNRNIYDLNGGQDTICNSQMVYDPKLQVFYAMSDVHPFDEFQWPTNLPLETRVTMINDFGSAQIGDCFANEDALWVNIASLDEETLSYPRIHNTCFERDEYGWMIEEDKIDIFYTMAPLGEDWKVLYTYRIHRYTLEF
ncbi:MAG TPA: hypothetical protein PKV57_01035 [Bacilli bacterium]|nr:hypothetical protein [Bacilli bacterium]